MTTYGPIQLHDGGECPVKPTADVRVLWDYWEVGIYDTAGNLDWSIIVLKR